MPLAKGVTMETVARNAGELKSSGVLNRKPAQSWTSAFDRRRKGRMAARKKKVGRPAKSLVVKGLV